MRALVLSAVLCFITPLSASGQQTPLRTADGRPDLAGLWDGTWSIPLEATPQSPALEISEAQAEAGLKARRARQASIDFPIDPLAALVAERPNPRIAGKLRSRMVVEPAIGRIPYSPTALAAIDTWSKSNTTGPGPGPRANPEDRTLPERCLALNGHPPLMYPHEPGGLRQIIQTPSAIVIYSETGAEARIIRMNEAHLPATIRTRLGDSTGRWEGDTLVVETTNFPASGQLIDLIFQPPIQIGRDSRVIEWFKPVSAGELLYRFTIEDASLYTGPWLAEYPLMKSTATPREYACHEGNVGLANILSGARAEERTGKVSKR